MPDKPNDEGQQPQQQPPGGEQPPPQSSTSPDESVVRFEARNPFSTLSEAKAQYQGVIDDILRLDFDTIIQNKDIGAIHDAYLTLSRGQDDLYRAIPTLEIDMDDPLDISEARAFDTLASAASRILNVPIDVARTHLRNRREARLRGLSPREAEQLGLESTAWLLGNAFPDVQAAVHPSDRDEAPQPPPEEAQAGAADAPQPAPPDAAVGPPITGPGTKSGESVFAWAEHVLAPDSGVHGIPTEWQQAPPETGQAEPPRIDIRVTREPTDLETPSPTSGPSVIGFGDHQLTTDAGSSGDFFENQRTKYAKPEGALSYNDIRIQVEQILGDSNLSNSDAVRELREVISSILQAGGGIVDVNGDVGFYLNPESQEGYSLGIRGFQDDMWVAINQGSWGRTRLIPMPYGHDGFILMEDRSPPEKQATRKESWNDQLIRIGNANIKTDDATRRFALVAGGAVAAAAAIAVTAIFAFGGGGNSNGTRDNAQSGSSGPPVVQPVVQAPVQPAASQQQAAAQPTATATPVPTDTPVPAPTATPVPQVAVATQPARPQPTATPIPLPQATFSVTFSVTNTKTSQSGACANTAAVGASATGDVSFNGQRNPDGTYSIATNYGATGTWNPATRTLITKHSPSATEVQESSGTVDANGNLVGTNTRTRTLAAGECKEFYQSKGQRTAGSLP